MNENIGTTGASAEKTLLETLEDVIDRLPPGTISLAEVFDMIGREGLLIFCVFLTLPFMIPVTIPGVSTVFGFAILLLGIGISIHRRPWLPDKIMKRPFPSDKMKTVLAKGIIWVRRLEKVSRPRLLALTHGPVMHSVNGLLLIAGAILLMAPFGLIPFSNTLPGLAILFLALGMLQRDGRSILIGYATIVLTVFYFAFLLLGGSVLIYKLVELVRSWFASQP